MYIFQRVLSVWDPLHVPRVAFGLQQDLKACGDAKHIVHATFLNLGPAEHPSTYSVLDFLPHKSFALNLRGLPHKRQANVVQHVKGNHHTGLDLSSQQAIIVHNLHNLHERKKRSGKNLRCPSNTKCSSQIHTHLMSQEMMMMTGTTICRLYMF